MKRFINVILPLVLTLCLTCCGHDGDEVLRQAASVMQERPDSALRLLQSLDRHRLRGEREARYALLYTMAQNKCGLDVSRDSLLRIAYEFYLCHPKHVLAPRAYLYMGRYYSLNDSTKKASECLLQSMQLAELRKDYYTEYLALDDLRRVIAAGNPRQALAYAKDACRLYEEKCPPNIYNKVQLLLGIVCCYNLCNETDSALWSLDQALPLAQKHGDSALIGDVYQDYALVYESAGEYGQSLLYAKKAWDIAPERKVSLVQNLATAYQNADSLVQAALLYKTVAEQGNLTYKFTAYQELAQIARKQSEESAASEYTDSMVYYLGEMYMNAVEDNAQYSKERERMLADKYAMQTRTIYIRWILIVIGLMALCIPVLFYYVHKAEVSKQMLAREKAEYASSKAEAEKKNIALALKNRKLQIATMRKILMAKIPFLQKIREHQDNTHSILIDDKDWREVTDFLNGSDNLFVKRLTRTHRELTEKDIQLCMLLRLQLTTAQLSSVYCISEDSIKKKLLRLKEKTGISDASMRTYIEQF